VFPLTQEFESDGNRTLGKNAYNPRGIESDGEPDSPPLWSKVVQGRMFGTMFALTKLNGLQPDLP